MSSEEAFAEAVQAEEIERISSRAGDFNTARVFRSSKQWFLDEAARLELEGK